MLKVLINAYACSPDMGSEPGMAWNWCSHLAKYCELFIITEGEFKDKIEATLPKLSQGKNMHFYYNPVSGKIRKMCWNQGDWRFYKHYKLWQYKTYLLAKDICGKEQIDLLHQLNMIGFREPGYLWKLSKERSIPFVWGPIGGLKTFPKSFLKDAELKQRIFNFIKNSITILQLKYGQRINHALRTASALISSVPDSQRAIRRYKGLDSVIIPETGCFDIPIDADANRFDHSCLRLLWVGKFDYRKQLELALLSVAKFAKDLSLKPENIRLVVCGTGSPSQIDHYHRLEESLHMKGIVDWKGQCSHDAISHEMQQSDMLFFTSVNDDTSTVVMEALSCHLPVMCHDAMGFGYVVNDSCGIKVPLRGKSFSVDHFAEEIKKVYHDRAILKCLSEGCKEVQHKYLWDNKAKEMLAIYKKAVAEHSKSL
jgi:glycosyltransferase involved in cell wall biosynthesis